jgi:hypothetical protein
MGIVSGRGIYMATSDELLRQLIDALVAEGCSAGLEDFEVESITRIGRMRIARDRAIRDREAAMLLPLGAMVVAERQGCCRATAYNRAARARKSKVAVAS